MKSQNLQKFVSEIVQNTFWDFFRNYFRDSFSNSLFNSFNKCFQDSFSINSFWDFTRILSGIHLGNPSVVLPRTSGTLRAFFFFEIPPGAPSVIHSTTPSGILPEFLRDSSSNSLWGFSSNSCWNSCRSLPKLVSKFILEFHKEVHFEIITDASN